MAGGFSSTKASPATEHYRVPVATIRSCDELSPRQRGDCSRIIVRESQRLSRLIFARAAVDGGDYRELYTVASSRSRIDHLAWTKDGLEILFSMEQDDKWKIMRIPAEGGNPGATDFHVSNAGDLLNISLSPDGKRLAFSTMKRLQELWAIDNLLSVLK